jgi:hypothetical protein
MKSRKRSPKESWCTPDRGNQHAAYRFAAAVHQAQRADEGEQHEQAEQHLRNAVDRVEHTSIALGNEVVRHAGCLVASHDIAQRVGEVGPGPWCRPSISAARASAGLLRRQATAVQPVAPIARLNYRGDARLDLQSAGVVLLQRRNARAKALASA